MDEMMREISKYANGTYLKVEWGNGKLVLGGRIDTIYESDNGLDEDDAGYKEFYACAFRIDKIFKNPKDTIYEVGSLIEISVENKPTLITLQSGSMLWKNN